MNRQGQTDNRESFFLDILAGKSAGQQMVFMDGDGNLALLLIFDVCAERDKVRQELEMLAGRAARE